VAWRRVALSAQNLLIGECGSRSVDVKSKLKPDTLGPSRIQTAAVIGEVLS